MSAAISDKFQYNIEHKKVLHQLIRSLPKNLIVLTVKLNNQYFCKVLSFHICLHPEQPGVASVNMYYIQICSVQSFEMNNIFGFFGGRQKKKKKKKKENDHMKR